MIAAVVLVLALTAPDGSIRTVSEVMPADRCKAVAREFLTERRMLTGELAEGERPRWAHCLALHAIGADA